MARYRFNKPIEKIVTPVDRPAAQIPAWPVFLPQIDDLRQTGIEVIGAVPWGTHFCQFYATSQDLVETLVPYFRAGLEGNEFCMWVTSAPLQVDQALAALRSAVPDLDAYQAKGQIEILDYKEWYTPTGSFEADSVLQGWTDKLAGARQKGFEGLRLTGNTFWLEQALWDDFTRYEAKINDVIGEQRMLALCTYSLEKCGAREILDVVANHQFALIKTGGRWEIIESSTHRMIEQALRESEERYRNLFEGMTEGFGLHEIICDAAGNPCDYRFLDINPAFERLTGLKREAVVGRRLTEVLPGDDPRWVELYGKVALTGEPVRFENYSPGLKMNYEVYAYRPAPGQFAVIFTDITGRKRADEQIHLQSAALEATASGVLITDSQGIIQWANPAFCRLSGYTLEEAAGKNPRDLIRSGVHDPAFFQQLWRTILSGQVWRGEIINRRKDGSVYPEEMTITPVLSERGEITHFIAIQQDISERKRVEELARARTIQVEIQRRLLEQREQERLQISRDLHDGPVQDLTAATFALQEMSMAEPDSELSVRLDEVRLALQAQIGELRAFAQELRPPTLAKFGLAKAIRSHASTLQEKYPELTIEIENETDGELVPQEMRLALFRIYQESMKNIAKHARATRVHILLHIDEQQVRLEIQDNGAGFDPPRDWLELARHGHLGLVGIRERAEAIGGTLEIHSQPNQGTQIQVAIRLHGQVDSLESDRPSAPLTP